MRRSPKEEAKAILKDHDPRKLTLLFLLSTSGLSILMNLFVPNVFVAFASGDLNYIQEAVTWNEGMGLFLTVLVTLFAWVMKFGFRQWALRVARDQTPPISSLIEGFGIVNKVISLFLLQFLYMYGWFVLTVFAISFPLAGLFYASASVTPNFSFYLLIIVASVIGLGLWLMLEMRYACNCFALSDSVDESAMKAISTSVARYKEDKKGIFQVYLSFWRWFVVFLLVQASYFMGNFVMNSRVYPEAIELKAWEFLLTTQHPVVYACSIVADWIFLVKFLPLFNVALAVFYCKDVSTHLRERFQ